MTAITVATGLHARGRLAALRSRQASSTKWSTVQLVEKADEHCRPTGIAGRDHRDSLRSSLSGVQGLPVRRAADVLLSATRRTMRRPDVALVWAEPVARADLANEELRIAPDLVVEVVSPTNRRTTTSTRRVERIPRRSGVPVVWVVGPVQRDVYVHRHEPARSRRIPRRRARSKMSRCCPGLVVQGRRVFLLRSRKSFGRS